MAKYKQGKNLYVPAVKVPDPIQVPPDTIYTITEHPSFAQLPFHYLESLKGKVKRDWFSTLHYLCLPLTIGSQHGFIIKSLTSFSAVWDGGDQPENTKIIFEDDQPIKESLQLVSSHFGSGIITVQNRWAFRTPKGVSLMTVNPPNFFKHGTMFMTAVIETDNLRRDFTFNIKLTKPNEVVSFNKGDPVGCIIPYPRYFIDNFKVEPCPEGSALETERRTMQDYAKLRHSAKGQPDLLYMQGMDVYRNEFTDHQKSLDGAKRCPFH